jgi:hypothetical protein
LVSAQAHRKPGKIKMHSLVLLFLSAEN